MTEIKSGILLSYISLILRFGVGFFLSPFILAHLGPGEYGVYTVAGTIIGWLALCDFGLSASATKFLSEYQAKGDAAGEAHHMGMILCIFSIMGAFVLVAGICIFPFLADIFPKFNAEEMRICRILYLLTLFNVVVMFPARSLGGVAASRQKFKVPGLVGVLMATVNAIGVVILLMNGFRSVGLTVFSVTTGVIGLVWNLYYCFSVLKVRMSWSGWDGPLCRSLFAFSVWMFLDRVIGIMNTGSGSFIIGMTRGAEEITVYSYGMHLFQHFYTASGCIAGFFLPRVVGLVVNGASNAEQTDMMIRVGRAQLIVLACLFFGIICFGKEFFHLWIGDSLGNRTDDCWFVSVVILIPYGFLLLQALGWQLQQARNVMKDRVVVLFWSSLLALIVGFVLSIIYGVKGLALGTSISVILGQGVYMNWYYWRRMKLEIARFFKETLQRAWLWTPLLLGMAWLLNQWIPAEDWFTFFFKIGLFSVFYAIIIFFLYANKTERKMALSFIQKKSS